MTDKKFTATRNVEITVKVSGVNHTGDVKYALTEAEATQLYNELKAALKLVDVVDFSKWHEPRIRGPYVGDPFKPPYWSGPDRITLDSKTIDNGSGIAYQTTLTNAGR